MGWRWIVFLALLVSFCFPVADAGPDREFTRDESYELSELLWWGSGLRDGMLQYVEWDAPTVDVCSAGWAGVLFSDVSVTSRVLLCPPDGGKRLELSIPMSPLYIEKRLSGKVGELRLEDYLKRFWGDAREVWTRGRSGWGEKAFRLQNKGSSVWLILRTEHGLNGLVGTTQLVLFGSRAAAEKDSQTEKHY